ncbi:hypothetical protein K5I29_02815 [Flavobacterium agricola]|uniref:6-phosphogluconate dehydrogenase n=1 Tax=Flavobacterium agricola TaxID=2870839 RepID=A0ABY6LZZ3_9FLAO|nr:hypothetical protein [Flavobacterium agricola]UYW01867.1 hypothetical protein K5I29_02815 [Flavobacterium agricola]
MKKFLIPLFIVIFLALAGIVYYKYYFVFGEGVKSGYLNYAVKKGNVFKTYEGMLIQEGFGGTKKGQFSSYEFEFSVVDKEIFEVLEKNSGKVFDLRYKEYHNAIPWRGNTAYIVDSILSMK